MEHENYNSVCMLFFLADNLGYCSGIFS